MRKTILIALAIFASAAAHAASAQKGAKQDSGCLFELIAMSGARVTVNLHDVSSYSVEEMDGGEQVVLSLKSGASDVLYLPHQRGIRTASELRRAAARCMR